MATFHFKFLIRPAVDLEMCETLGGIIRRYLLRSKPEQAIMCWLCFSFQLPFAAIRLLGCTRWLYLFLIAHIPCPFPHFPFAFPYSTVPPLPVSTSAHVCPLLPHCASEFSADLIVLLSTIWLISFLCWVCNLLA